MIFLVGQTFGMCVILINVISQAAKKTFIIASL